jgi:enamine deaminase RidA (YjgF/YER057c/UK114 family)
MGPVEPLQPAGVAAPLGHLSNATRVGTRLYVAGLISLDENGELVGRGSVREQTLHICSVLKGICEQYGAGLEDVARCLVFLTDRSRYVEYDAAFAEAFGEHRPARATVIADLVGEEFLVEIVSDVELPA